MPFGVAETGTDAARSYTAGFKGGPATTAPVSVSNFASGAYSCPVTGNGYAGEGA
jgi:hypothetical protein